MELHSPGRTVVVGVGNIIHSDDGAGVHALRKLERDPRVPPDVVFVDGGTHGIDLLAHLHDASRLLLLDGVDVGEQPGSLVRMTSGDLLGLQGGASVHQIGVADLLATLPLISGPPKEVFLVGIQVASTDWGTQLTPQVEAAVNSLLDAAVEQLRLWSAQIHPTTGSTNIP